MSHEGGAVTEAAAHWNRLRASSALIPTQRFRRIKDGHLTPEQGKEPCTVATCTGLNPRWGQRLGERQRCVLPILCAEGCAHPQKDAQDTAKILRIIIWYGRACINAKTRQLSRCPNLQTGRWTKMSWKTTGNLQTSKLCTGTQLYHWWPCSYWDRNLR